MIDPHAPMHHLANVAAVGVPVVSWFANAQPALTGILTAMGIVWYIILYAKEWRNRKK
jgi:hypothetical protein